MNIDYAFDRAKTLLILSSPQPPRTTYNSQCLFQQKSIPLFNLKVKFDLLILKSVPLKCIRGIPKPLPSGYQMGILLPTKNLSMNLCFQNVPVSVLICPYLVRTWYGLDTDLVSLDLIIIPLLREIFFDASGVFFFARFWNAF